MNQKKKNKCRITWMDAMESSPLRGFTKLYLFPINIQASARASSVCGKCRLISSPSKSALYGVQTHSLNWKVRWGTTLALWHMMDSLCNEGWRFNRTISPSHRCRSTRSPGCRSLNSLEDGYKTNKYNLPWDCEQDILDCQTWETFWWTNPSLERSWRLDECRLH